ncbi:MAG: manganese efflux pump MntP family protein [Paraprevotella sp.]|nr:manganese efflux pump MntP family protein [Paraprevotella sp.]
MTNWEIWLLGIALAMDCFTVSIACGIQKRRFLLRPMLTMAVLFGLFQGCMTIAGSLGMSVFSHYLEDFDHWIAFALLGYVGGSMIYESFKDEEHRHTDMLRPRVMLTLAVATSIDALAVGISFACLHIDTLQTLLYPASVIAFASFALSVLGLGTGIGLGRKIHLPVELIGGCILIIIGIKILFEHLS